MFNYLTVWFTNADFLTNKFDEFANRIAISQPSIVSVVETAFQENPLNKNYYPDGALHIQGYQMFRQDNHTEVKGGILVYIKDTINVSRTSIKKLNNISAETKESLWLEIEAANESLLFGTIYRKGKSSATNDRNIRDMIDIAAKHFKRVMICGDFNMPKIDWKLYSTDASDYSPEMRFINCLDDNFLTQHTVESTRCRGTDNPSTLDLVITDNGQTQAIPKIEAGLGKSDHAVLTWRYLINVDEEEEDETVSKPRKNYYKADIAAIKTALSKIDWEDTFNEHSDYTKCDLDGMLDTFYEKVTAVIDEHVPDSTGKIAKIPLGGIESY